ncbi:MAG: phosphate ABC transporter substrate-binding protein PstS [Oligoflexia bacterium]|nr:phosphate ABC transporter substrate-binding protein PstS [Oligoflexia bacterium]
MTSISSSQADTISVNGAGATFPYPLYSKWFVEFGKSHPGIEINYQSVGSGAGVRQLLDKTVDFGASDAPMTNEQLAKATTPIIHIPTTLGAVVITYNLPGIGQSLKLSASVIADIFLGKITQWDDARIAQLNAGVALPKGLAILVAYRSDGSGTTAVFADYLSKVSPAWSEKVGTGTSLSWPTGLGGKGNEGVTAIVKGTVGAVGYTELTYAKTNNLPVAWVQNKAGQFIEPTPASVTAAAAATKSMPADFRVSITNADGKAAYPISSFTYLLVYQKMGSVKGQAIVSMLKWAMTDGQKMAEPLHYAPIPKAMIQKIENRIKEISLE